MLSLLKTAGETLVSLLYPASCASCAAAVAEGKTLCELCEEKTHRIVAPFCQTCSQPFHGSLTQDFSCPNCAHRTLHFSCAVAAFESRGVVRELIHRFKYQHHYYLRKALAEWLMVGFNDPRIAVEPFDALVPVPLHPVRMREREFNQAAVLSELASERTGTPVFDCLQRVRNTRTQTRLDRRERMENLLNAFRTRKDAPVHGRRILLVDDVFTTGSTADECARVLQACGAASVRVITVARG